MDNKNEHEPSVELADEGTSLEEASNVSKAEDLEDLIEDHGDDPEYFAICAKSLLGEDWPLQGAQLLRHVTLDGRDKDRAVELIHKFKTLMDANLAPQ